MKSKTGETLPVRRLRTGPDGRTEKVAILRPGAGARRASWFLLGDAFGTVCAVLAENYSDALDEFDEHFGERVEPDDVALRDYSPNGEATAQGRPDDVARMWSAIDAGDARMNDGGTVVWVDPHEWGREVKQSAARRRRVWA